MLQLLKKILPPGLKTWFMVNLRNRVEKYWIKRDRQYPKHDFTEELVTHARVLHNRESLLKHLPGQGVVAELGVNKGDFSEKILRINGAAKLHLVDPWGDNWRYHDGLKAQVQQRFANEIAQGRVQLHVGYSTEVGRTFPDQYFDWIYIDTTHTYALTKAELELYGPKMKPGGIMAGHDYIDGQWNRMMRYGVIEAVNEFCVNHNWELLYLTAERSDHPSFAVRKRG